MSVPLGHTHAADATADDPRQHVGRVAALAARAVGAKNEREGGVADDAEGRRPGVGVEAERQLARALRPRLRDDGAAEAGVPVVGEGAEGVEVHAPKVALFGYRLTA